MRIGWEGAFFSYHSLSIINREVVSRLLKRGYDIHPENTEAEQFAPTSNSCQIIKRAMNSFSPSVSNDYDVHIRLKWPPSFEKKGKKNILNQPWEFGPIPKLWVEGLANIDRVIAISNFVKYCFLISGYNNVDVIPCGVDTEKFNPDAPPLELETNKRFKFLFVGGVIARKGIDVLIKSYLATFTRKDDVCLVIKGMGSESFYKHMSVKNDILKLAEDKFMPEIIYLEDDIPDEKMPSLYTACNAFVYPFRGEGFGMPILEAIACGLPVIVTGYGPVLDYLPKHYEYFLKYKIKISNVNVMADGRELVGNWFLAEPDFIDLRNKMKEVYNNYDKAKDIIDGIRKQISISHSWNNIASMYEKKIIEVYES